MQRILTKLYGYNKWRYEKIFNALEKQEDLKVFLLEDNKLFFSNVKNTLIHNLCADYVWYGRILKLNQIKVPRNKEFLQIDLQQLITYWQSDDPEIFSKLNISYEKVKELLMDMNSIYLEMIQQSKQEYLDSKFSYQDSKKLDKEQVISDVLFHLINHHTHHIGQISTIFTQKYGRQDYFSIDLIYYQQ